MAPCVRECDVKCTPATIWSRCIVGMKWEEWDEDVTSLEGTEKGLIEGESYSFLMKSGSKIPVIATSVVEKEKLSYKGGVLGGLIQFEGLIEISPSTEGSHIKYTFNMFGLLGAPFYYFKPYPVIHGTTTGLANLVRLSEEAQKALSK